MRLMRRGAEARHVGETRLNHESSRSHSVFTCSVQRESTRGDSGLTNMLFSRLNLIDLAGGWDGRHAAWRGGCCASVWADAQVQLLPQPHM